MMPPVLGLQDLLSTGLHRRIGACAAAMVATTLGLAAVVDIAPVAADEAPEDIADRLIQSVAGYDVAPEGSGARNSRAVTLEDLAAIAGTELPDLGGEAPAGYMRWFGTPAGDGVATVFGLDLSGGDAADFIAGFREASDEQASAVTLFPDAASPLGDVVAYEIPDPASSRQAAATAFASDSLVVELIAADPSDSLVVLRRMAQDQAALTPPITAAAGTRDHTAAYQLGRITGFLAMVGGVVWLIVRVRRDPERPAPVGPDQAAPQGSLLYPARRPGIPLPPLESSPAAPPTPAAATPARHPAPAAGSGPGRLTSRPGAQ